MSDEQLGETSISQGHSTFGSCDGICIFMCEYGNLILKYQIRITEDNVSTDILLGGPGAKKKTEVDSDAVHPTAHVKC